MTADAYVQSVIDNVPRNLPLRDQIAKELGAHIAERMQHGQPLDDVLRNLGDPLKLAESYLAAEPLKSAPFWPRAMAKIVDFAIVLGVAVLFCLRAVVHTAAEHRAVRARRRSRRVRFCVPNLYGARRVRKRLDRRQAPDGHPGSSVSRARASRWVNRCSGSSRSSRNSSWSMYCSRSSRRRSSAPSSSSRKRAQS